MTKIIFIAFLAALLFTRFYNLEYTARFTEDESGFLVRTHQIYKERKITLVGQVNEMGTKVFASSTVYLLLPFAVLGGFGPVSLFYGAAFWGVLTGVAMLLLAKKYSKKISILAVLTILFWFPLVQSGRWAWNPNFIPFWVSLGIIFSLSKSRWLRLAGGICFGLAVHHHYYAIFATGIYIAIVFLKEIAGKEKIKSLLMVAGFIGTLLPFIVFDLRHPPGIFLLGAAQQAQGANAEISSNIISYSSQVLQTYTLDKLSGFAAALLMIVLVIIDVKKHKKALVVFGVAFSQILAMATLNTYFPHYFLALIPFLFLWLIHPRKGFGKIVAALIMLVLIYSGILNSMGLLTKTPVEPSLTTVKKIDQIVKREIAQNGLKNVNLAVLASPDRNTSGRKYRDLLLVPDNMAVLSKDEYHLADLLFVVSTAEEEVLRQDPALELTNFRSGELRDEWETDGWKVYLFAKNP